MKKNIQSIQKILCVISLMWLASCSDPESFFEAVTDVELPPHVSRLVIRADWESNTDSVAVFVTKSRGSLDASPYNYYSFDTVANTQVEVFKNGQLLGTIPYMKGGYHVSKGFFKIDTLGSVYKIRVSAPNFETVEAEQRTMKLPSANNLTYRVGVAVRNDPFGGTEKGDEIAFDIQDIASEQNYYDISSPSLAVRDSVGNFYTNNISVSSLDPLAEENILPDVSFNGRTYRWRLVNEDYGQYCYNQSGRYICRTPRAGDRLTLTLRSVSKDWFSFRKSRNLLRDAQDNMFFSEPVILHTNVKKGYGIFSIYSRKRITFTLQ